LVIKEDYRWLYGKLDPNREYRIVKEVFAQNNLKIGKILRKPIDGLVEYHLLHKKIK